MSLTISSQSASYYSAANYRSSVKESGSDSAVHSGGYYSVAKSAAAKEPEKAPVSDQAAAYDRVNDLYDYAKANLELSKLSLFSPAQTGGVSFAAITNAESYARTQQTLAGVEAYSALESIANSQAAVSLGETGLKNLYNLVLEGNTQKAQYVQSTLAMQNSISSYSKAESNFKGALRIFDASV